MATQSRFLGDPVADGVPELGQALDKSGEAPSEALNRLANAMDRAAAAAESSTSRAL